MKSTRKKLSLLAAVATFAFAVSPAAEAAVRVGVAIGVPVAPHVRVAAVVPAPRPAGVIAVTAGPVWVPSHYNRYGAWVPGHWRY